MQTGPDLKEIHLFLRNQTYVSKGGSHEVSQKPEGAGAITPFAGTGVPSSAETPWENPGISLRQRRKGH